MDAIVDGLEKAPGSFLEEGKNFGKTLVKAATQGTDGLGSAGIFSKGSTAPPRSVMNSRRSPCCARAASGHAPALPMSVMNSRLFTRSLRRRGRAKCCGADRGCKLAAFC